MKYDAKKEQEKFWALFDKKLAEKGWPFNILHEKAGEVTFWATVNKRKSFVDKCISIDFLVRYHILRLNIYIRKDLSLFSMLEEHRDEIESIISVPVQWVPGTENPNTRRIKHEIALQIGNVSEYENAIEQAIPIIEQYIAVCKRYASRDFLDY